MEPTAAHTARGSEEPFARQFSVFMPNRVGQFGDILDDLAEHDVRIIGVSVVDATDWAVIRLIFDDANLGREMLNRRGQSFTETEILLVQLDADDTLRQLCSYLVGAEINVHFAYPLTIRSRLKPVMAVHVDDHVLATHILTRHGMTLLGNEDLDLPS
ncbi:MAG: acetolactate synthase [Planctomycetes bacterium]|jgi:hypothetical protein|nr:acetolactate synthase [Planctomycetota bacterium]